MPDLFCKNPGYVLTRGQLLEKLWDAEEKYVDEHTLTTAISRIRVKIEEDAFHRRFCPSEDDDKPVDRDARHLYAVLSGYTGR